jgi:hypothetical protein
MNVIGIIDKVFTLAGFSSFMQILFLVLEMVYVLFAFMLTRQIRVMNHNFDSPAAPIFTMMARINLIGSLVVVFLSILAL